MNPERHLKQHSQLQANITRDFVSHFAPTGKLIYLQDGARQTLLFDREIFASIGVPLDSFSGLPDTILFDEPKNLLFLIQAITIRYPTPISNERHQTLKEQFEKCTADQVYVNAFLDFPTFRNFIDDLSLESEIWIAETPSHLVRMRK